MTERSRSIAGACLFITGVIALYASVLAPARSFGGRDLTVYNLPIEKDVHDAYSRGRLPVWSAAISGGRPLLSNPNAGALYPIRPLLSALPFAAAMRIFPVLHWALSGAGVIALLRALGASPAAAWVGAATYAFSGIGVGNVFFPHTHPGVTLLPWILWALARPAANPSRRWIGLSILFALDFLAGDVFTAGLAIVSGLLWILLELPRGNRRGLAMQFGLSLALGALGAFPQILATALWIPGTSRAVQGLRLWETLFFSIPPVRLLELAIPFPFGPTWQLDPSLVWAPGVFHGKTVGLFPTLYCGAFAVAACAFVGRTRRAGSRFAFALLLLGLLFAVLPGFLPRQWADAPSPVALRNPEKMAVAIVLGLSILAGIAFDLRRRRTTGTGWMLSAGAAFAAAAWLLHFSPSLAALAASAPRLASEASGGLPGAIAEAGLLWIATFLAVRLLSSANSKAHAAAAALLSAVPVISNVRIAQTFSEEEIFAPTAVARRIAREDPAGSFRVLGESLYRPDSPLSRSRAGGDRGQVEFARRDWVRYTPSLWGRGTVFNADFDAGDLSRTESLRRLSGVLSGSPAAAALFGSVGLRWGVRFRDQEPLPGYSRRGGDTLQDWDELAPASPDVRLLTDWTEEPDPVSALRALPRLSAGQAVIESGRERSGHAPGGLVRILEKTPERLVLETSSPADGWLFVLRGYWRHRSVRLDGRDVAFVPAQLAFTAVPVPSGRHHIDWRERMPGGGISWFGPLLFVVVLVAIGSRRAAGAGPPA